MDSAKEQEEDEYITEVVHETDKFITLDPDQITPTENESPNTNDAFFKKIKPNSVRPKS